jgi:hypothetical protein
VKLSTYPAAATTGPVLGWVKSRLMLGVNGGVYETDVSQTAVTLGATQLRYQHPVAGWTWRCFGVSPSAILAAGDAGGQSAITQFNLNMVAGAPVLQVAGDIAPLPVGERVLSLLSSQGSFLAIGTTRGVRIGTFNTYTGALVYGPLHLGPLDPIIPAVGLAQRDRFIYAVGKSYDEAGLIRVDLGVQTDQSGRYAWTPDLIGPTAPTANPDIAQVGVSRVTEQGTAGTTSFVVNMPATVNAGELLFAAIGSGGGVTATPAGWTLAGGANQATADAIYGFYKTATGAEAGTTVTFTIGAAGRATGVVNRYSSVNGTPIDVTPATGQNTGVGSTVTVPQVVTVTDRTYGVTMAAVNAAVGISWTAPTGFTLVAASSGTGKGTAYASGYVQTPAGNTGTQTWQCSTVNLQMNALTVFLRPVAAPASTATSMTVLPQSGRIVFAIPGTGVLLEGVGPGSLREAWLRTSRIRYSTVEPKLFKLGRVRGDFLSGEIRVTAITPYTNQVVATAGFTASDPDEFRLLDGKAEWMQLMFDVIGATTKLTTYQVKALPGTRRQRHLQFVLSLADSVTGKTGQRIRDTLSSRDHLAALEALDAAGDEVVLQEFTPKGVISTRVVIEQVSFAQSLRPTRKSDLGGEITILLRTVES